MARKRITSRRTAKSVKTEPTAPQGEPPVEQEAGRESEGIQQDSFLPDEPLARDVGGLTAGSVGHEAPPEVVLPAGDSPPIVEAATAAPSAVSGEVAPTGFQGNGQPGEGAPRRRRRRRSRRGRRRREGGEGAPLPGAPAGQAQGSGPVHAGHGGAGGHVSGHPHRPPQDKPQGHTVDWNGGGYEEARETVPAGEPGIAAETASTSMSTGGPPSEPPTLAVISEVPPAVPGVPSSEKPKRGRSRRRGKGGAQSAAPSGRLGTGMEMLISVTPGEECRIAVTRDGRLEEFFLERASAESHVGNIYKGRITNVEPSIQAAFVDFGLNKNGFLHISDLIPQYFPEHNGEPEEIGRKTPRRDRPPIQRCLRRGQEVIVQITKEGIGTKGPTLTTYISVPGRFLVMMPGMNRLGVSRKIEEDEARRKMRDVLNQLDLPKSMGFILRTAGMDRTKRELQEDLNYLVRLWKTVTERIRSEKAPATLYQESDLAIRTVRDTLEPEVERIVIDESTTAMKVRDFLAVAMPNAAEKVFVYNDPQPLYHRLGIENQIEKLHGRYVALPIGGSLVIDSTEALVAIDVNSGKFREMEDAEETARRINLEAAEEIARQLRLRDLGGVIVCDFIDMRLEKNRRAVEKSLRDALKRHKERAKILRMSRFGIVEMTRQRTRPSISRSMHQDCPFCQGSGMVKTPETTILDVMRMIQLASHRDVIQKIEVQVHPEVAFQLQNRKRRSISDLEVRSGRQIVVRSNDAFGLDRVEYACWDARGQVLKFP